MTLERLTERVWIAPFEEERDRPTLGYIRGDHWSLAVDAGHSADHTLSFYRFLEAEGLPLPSLTVLTHWHWDHTFGMHAVNGLCIANAKTNRYLIDFKEKLDRNGPEKEFFPLHESIRREYEKDRAVIVRPADIVYTGEITLDAGNCPVRLLGTPSPHTDDSTLIHVINEGVLFVGDTTGGTFPTWEKDPALCRKLIRTLESIDFTTCVESHWTPDTKEALIRDLRKEIE